MFNFPSNMSDNKKKMYLRACQFCRDTFIDMDRLGLNLYDKVNFNTVKPGIIVSKVYLTAQTAMTLLNDFYISEYFCIKEYKKTLHILLNKKYINKIDELETLFKIQGII